MKKLYPILICLVAGQGVCAQFQYQLSYYNVSRPAGGPVVTGDFLDIRSVISVPSGSSITRLNYITNVPAGTSYVAGSMKVVTNENVVVGGTNTGSYTDAAGDDPGTNAAGALTFNIGAGAGSSTTTGGGNVTGGTTPPLFYNVASIYMTVYRVQVTAAVGSTISLSGSFRYKDPAAQTKNLGPYTIFVSPSYSCNTSDPTNLVVAETNGSFGSGNTQNRGSASGSVSGFTFVGLNASSPVDGQYALVNNTSGTGYSGGSPAVSDKVFGVWDVVGDHTGSLTGAGNPPAAPGATKGYMLAVNASFAPGVVFTTTVGGLLANSNYTLSFWVRNICPVCGNSPATGSSSGLPGVNPNLSFDIAGNNYFSSGDIAYSGSWVKQSFTFNTGVATTLTFTLKNNAPGGGGNDWVLDDLAVNQCLQLLPNSLIGFQAGMQTDGTLLTWQSADESGMDTYNIERSTDGFHFLTIGDQAVKGQNAGSNYYFTDNQTPARQNVYYRLRITYKDGQTGYSNIILIKDGSNAPAAAWLAPNPARNYANLYIKTTAAGTAQIRLLNLAGRSVYAQTSRVVAGQNVLSIPLPHTLSAGLYLVQTSTGGRTVYAKLVVE